MSPLNGKKILLLVTGSIAAYKSALLVRLLIKQQCEVKVLLSKSAAEFITPLTLATLSKNPVLVDFVSTDGTGTWHNHVELGLWADAIVVAPATANTIAKFAHGLCDNLLTATYLSAKCPIFFAPAMDLDMYKHPSTLHNIQLLQKYGNQLIPAEFGELASGLVGEGRMAEPEHIVAFLENYFAQSQTFAGYQVLVTAGPTYEPIDPVRFIGNHSTGKMGYAIAEAFAQQGAKVILVSGPSHLQIQHVNIQLHKVMTADEMYAICSQYANTAHIIVLSAAVADYKPAQIATQKIKKKDETLHLELTKNIDIAQTLGSQKQPHQFIVGFALETENEYENAFNKLQSKNLDMIVLNSLNDQGAGFGHDTNKVSIISSDGEVKNYPLLTKKQLATEILRIIQQKAKKG
ncbi:MAG: bifunctional phosphopantothenoylcysteine decarboxylase/phosphopantothenate--cysteine ligase CoaBC [Microscillaceae bacterium]|nr:bifunctional phosphopantothenoylcysteine decarboxylase/phosphopantothenate--cysteine ligase CoaBC [Microscillaceae bacterium]MDW8460504.1 bifunctional phosphopantothenoylcysteine decarboxylase/phosphopantothenate--cysteine ligase CoaBC [Cytophagales bacterium]